MLRTLPEACSVSGPSVPPTFSTLTRQLLLADLCADSLQACQHLLLGILGVWQDSNRSVAQLQRSNQETHSHNSSAVGASHRQVSL